MEVEMFSEDQSNASNGNKTVKGAFPNPATQFKGQPGPGRPKGSRNRSTIVREALEAKIRGEDGNETEVVDALVVAQVAKAMTGDTPAFKELMDSGYGKLTDKQELTGANGDPVSAIIRTVVDPKAE